MQRCAIVKPTSWWLMHTGWCCQSWTFSSQFLSAPPDFTACAAVSPATTREHRHLQNTAALLLPHKRQLPARLLPHWFNSGSGCRLPLLELWSPLPPPLRWCPPVKVLLRKLHTAHALLFQLFFVVEGPHLESLSHRYFLCCRATY